MGAASQGVGREVQQLSNKLVPIGDAGACTVRLEPLSLAQMGSFLTHVKYILEIKPTVKKID